MKTGRKTIFQPCEDHILSQFEKYRVSAQNLTGLTFNFNEKHLFTMKTRRKFIFQPREAHILSQLDATVLYVNF
jgi:hypothetical protein